MDFIENIQGLAARIEKQLGHLKTEEATKNALVMPFINAFGYNVFDPTEVVPEFSADVGVKKGEKVDYAVMKDGKVIMLFECKASNVVLGDDHASQLYRYFSVTEARIGVLINGVLYRFYSDLDEPNKMDSKPFLEFNMLDVQESLVGELKKLNKSSFDLDEIMTTAGELKYTREIKRILTHQLTAPSEHFVRFFVSEVYDGRFTQSVREEFTEFTRRALNQFVNEQINERLKSALAGTEGPERETSTQESPPTDETPGDTEGEKKIVTTVEELEAYSIVKAILREVVDPKRVAQRDQATYFSVLLDDNNRKPLCRLWFNSGQKYVGLFDGDKKEERVAIDGLDEIFELADRLKSTVALYT